MTIQGRQVMARRRWSELSNAQRRGIVLGALVQMLLQGAALRDLRHRPAEQINGPRWAWVCATFVNTVGPCAYFIFGRRRR
jgi:hypothetical protein